MPIGTQTSLILLPGGAPSSAYELPQADPASTDDQNRPTRSIYAIEDGGRKKLSRAGVRKVRGGADTHYQKTELYAAAPGDGYGRKDVVREFQQRFGDEHPHKVVGSRKRGWVAHSTIPECPSLIAVRSNEVIAREYDFDRPIGRHYQLAARDGQSLSELEVLDWLRRDIFPEQRVRGMSSLEKGFNIFVNGDRVPAMIIARAKSSDAHLLSALVLAQDAEDAKIVPIKYGGAQGPKHVEQTMLVATNDRARTQMRHFIEAEQRGRPLSELEKAGLSSGALRVGAEGERWVIDKETGELVCIYGVELLRGCDEEDDGHYIFVADAMNGFAQKRLAIAEQYPDALINSTSTSPTGSPQNTRTNFLQPEIGPYVVVTDLWDAQKIRERAKDPAALEVLTQIAHHHGFSDAATLLNTFPDTRLWNTAAKQFHVGPMNVYNPVTGLWEIDFDLAKNYQEVFNSELGAIFEMLCASGPYSFDTPISLGGELVYDVRHFIRTIMGTADSLNEFWRDAEHFKEIVADTMTQGRQGAHTLARAAFAHDPNKPDAKKRQRRKAIGHGVARARYTTPEKPLGTHEITAAGSAHILAGGRAFALAQVFAHIANLAYNEGKSAFSFIAEKTGITIEELKGNRHQTTQEFFKMGPHSEHAHTLLERLTTIISAFDFGAPELKQAQHVALEALKIGLYDCNFDELANGKGTIGGAMRELAEAGYTARQAALVLDAFERQEAQFWLGANPSEKEDYMVGLAGFEFEWPDVGAPGAF